MIFLNLFHYSPTKIHSPELLAETNKVVEDLLAEFAVESMDLKVSCHKFIEPLFDIYMKYNHEVFSPLSKALALEYSQNFQGLKRDINQTYSSRLLLHGLLWQDSQPGVHELVSNGKEGLLSYNGDATYKSFHHNATVKNELLKPVLSMVQSYILADLYAFLPILNDEGKISLTDKNWATLIEDYAETLDRFRTFAVEASILDSSKYPELAAV